MKTAPPDPGLLSLNTATVREKWSLREMIEGCARHGIRGISPWRDKLAAGSQLRAFLFDYYVSGPGVAAAYREAKLK